MSSVNRFEQFFLELDGLWGGADPRIALKVIGSTALMLQADYLRGTKDSDVVGVMPVAGEIKTSSRTSRGPVHAWKACPTSTSTLCLPGCHSCPIRPRFIPLDSLDARLGSFQVSALDVVDVVVSKLKRFNGNDLDDIRTMVDMELVEHEPLLERFRSAVDRFSMDARAGEPDALLGWLYASRLKRLNKRGKSVISVKKMALFF